jgi:predicted  nucleic acid-binding Zn-ribbon protein
MLQTLVTSQGSAILALAAARVAEGADGPASQRELLASGGSFLDEIGVRSRSPELKGHGLALGAAARGAALMAEGVPLSALVQTYVHLCQALREARGPAGEPLGPTDLGIIDRCCDEAIDESVRAYLEARDRAQAAGEVARRSQLAHDLRNHLNNAIMALEILHTGKVLLSGNVGMMLDRSITALRALLDHESKLHARVVA